MTKGVKFVKWDSASDWETYKIYLTTTRVFRDTFAVRAEIDLPTQKERSALGLKIINSCSTLEELKIICAQEDAEDKLWDHFDKIKILAFRRMMGV